ncbi:MAG: PKD domain-containing protein [Acidobacteria bacterium]|nr:PKD domain-containing protein [Acidobacteriota bacterium]
MRSTDGGNTWSQPDLNITTRNEGSWITVGPDHSVYVFYFDYVNNAAAAQIRMRKSTDQGLTFGPAVTAANLKQAGLSIFQFDNYLPLPFATHAFPQCVVNPVNAQQIYCTFNDLALQAGDRGDIYTTRSTDGGATWPQAAAPFDFTGSTDSDRDDFLPSIAIAPNPTDAANPARLIVSYYTRRRDAGNSLTDRWARIANIQASGVIGLPNAGFLVSPTAAPVTLNGDYSTTLWSYYEDITADEDYGYVPFVQARQSPTVPARTFQNDILFARFKLSEGFGPLISYVSTTITGGNGNAQVDPDECNEFTITVRNYGSIGATAVTGELISGTPGVTISFANSPYPNIGAFGSGDTQSNTLKFYVNTSAAIICGQTLNFTLRLTTAQGVFDVPFSLTANPGFATFSNNTVTPIPDRQAGVADGNLNSVIPVSGLTGNVTKIAVRLNVTHTFISDIVGRLRSPNNVVVYLVAGRGGSGDNFGTSCANRTIFDQAAATAIGTGTAPFAGSFQPEPGPRNISNGGGLFLYPIAAGNTLNTFNGLNGANLNGNWTLELFDIFAADTGTLNCWSLDVTTTTTACAGNGGVGCTLTTTCSATPQTGNAPLLVNFDANPAGGGGSFTYAWDFGDGFTGNIKNPSHTYVNAGSYTATVTVKDLLSPMQPTITCSKVITVGQTFATPTIASASPNCGNVTGGTVVVINGTNFEPQATVSLAGVPATVTVDSSTQITATSANRAPAPAFTGDIVVSNGPGATATLTNGYTYAVRGDANNTGDLQAADIFAINARLTLGIPAVLPSLCNFDANTSGAIEASDMFFLNSVLLGLIGPPGP